MKINFIGNTLTGVGGEPGDETHLVRELKALGHDVNFIPRDEWREHVLDGKPYKNVPEDLKADVNVVCKWHHFYDGRFITALKERSGAPVFYWVWDYMWDQGLPQWHLDAIESCDVYLGNDVMSGKYPNWIKDKLRYFNFDCVDANNAMFKTTEKEYDVVFLGNYLGQGHRIEWLKEIKNHCNLKIFSANFQEWIKNGFDAEPAVYGEQANKVISLSKINIGFSVESNCWGYWSNRVGRVLWAGGFLLYEYAPGMEVFLGDKVQYFSSTNEAVNKIKYYLEHGDERESIVNKLSGDFREKFTSRSKVKELEILIENYI